jgi:hypothetical protein
MLTIEKKESVNEMPKKKNDYKAKQENEKFQYILKHLRKNKMAHFLDINLQQTT